MTCPAEALPSLATRRELLLGTLFAGTAAFTFTRLPRTPVIAVPGRSIGESIPTNVGRWRAVQDGSFVLPPNDELAAAAVYEEQLARSYADGAGAPIMLLIAYARHQSGMLMIHRPESCYPGSGFTINSIHNVTISLAAGLSVAAQFLSTRRDARVEQVLYWTRLGTEFPRTWHDERWSLAMQSLAGKVPDGALVRMSVIDADVECALTRLKAFAQALFAASSKDGKALLGGPKISDEA